MDILYNKYTNKKQLLLDLIKENPELPVIPLVGRSIWDCYDPNNLFFMGRLGNSFVGEYCHYTFHCDFFLDGGSQNFIMEEILLKEEVYRVYEHLKKYYGHLPKIERDNTIELEVQQISWKKAIFVYIEHNE